MDQDLLKDPIELVEKFKNPKWGAQKLKVISLFAKFTEQELSRLYSMGKLLKLKPKSHAVVEGEPTRGMFLLLYGTVSVYKSQSDADSLVRLAILEEGASFGELSLFDDAPRSATVVAESTCFLFQLNADEFDRFLNKTGPDIQVRFYRTCAEELAQRFRTLNGDYISAQMLLWKHALRRDSQAA